MKYLLWRVKYTFYFMWRLKVFNALLAWNAANADDTCYREGESPFDAVYIDMGWE